MQSRTQLREQILASPHYALWVERDLQWARRMNVSTRSRVLRAVLVTASWLGDGIFWYALIGGLAFLGGTNGRDVAAQMALAAVLNFTLYSFLKRWTGRPRPFVACPDIRACARALDRFSFPSGHVQHALAFTIILLAHFPAAAFWLLPITVLITLSRVTLGLHYPSDVAAGAAIGTIVAGTVIALY